MQDRPVQEYGSIPGGGRHGVTASAGGGTLLHAAAA